MRELREALTSGQRAMKQGDLTGAEQELHRVLQLDQNNPQAAELLEQIRQDRLSREQDFRLKEALWQSGQPGFRGELRRGAKPPSGTSARLSQLG